MAAFHKPNICWCNYQLNPYKQIHQKIRNYCALNGRSSGNLAKFQSSQDILLNNGPKVPQLSDKEIYEICCSSKKRNSIHCKKKDGSAWIRNKYFSSEMEVQENHVPGKQKNRRNPAKMGGETINPYAVSISIAKRPQTSWNRKSSFSRPSLQFKLSESTSFKYEKQNAQQPTIPNNEEHGRKLKENVRSEDSKKYDTIKQNRNNKRKGVDKFQQKMDLKKTQSARRTHRFEKKKDNHYRNAFEPQKGTEETKKAKSFSENSEQALFNQFSKQRAYKSSLRRTVEVDTSVGIYRKAKQNNKSEMSSKPYSSLIGKVNQEVSENFTTLRSMHELKIPEVRTSDRIKTSAPYTETFDKMLEGKANKISEFHPILKSSNRLGHSPKFSWASKKKLKGRSRTETNTFDKLLKDSDMAMPEHHHFLTSRTLLNAKRDKKETTGKSKPDKDLEPGYGLHDSKTYRHMKGDNRKENHSKPFGQMLSGKEKIVPELNRALTSRFRINHDGKSTNNSFWMEQDPIMSTSLYANLPIVEEPVVSQSSEKVIKPKKTKVMRPYQQISVIKKPEILQAIGKYSVAKEAGDPKNSGTIPLAGPKKRKSQPESTNRSRTSSEFSFGSVGSLRKRFAPTPGRKIRLKKFFYYIQNSMPDRKILTQMNSKNPISYLKSEKNSYYGRSPSQTSSDRYQPSLGSIISTVSIAQSLIPKQQKEHKKDEPHADADAHLFATFPEDYDPVDGIKKTMNDIIAGVAKEEKVHEKTHKKSQSQRAKNKSRMQEYALEAHGNVVSILSLRRTSQEVKTRESQAVRDLHFREQMRESFYANARPSVQARIDKLMKEVAIRDDFRPKKKPRDFVTENIVRLSNMQPTKGSQAVDEVKPQRKYPSLLRILAPNEEPVPKISEDKMSPEMHPRKPVRVRLYSDKIWRDQMDIYQSEMKKPPPDAKVCRLSERKKCDCYLCKLLLKGKNQHESNFMKKAMAQRRRLELRSYYLELRKRERDREMNPAKIC
ncbi:uncharacterized protein LOC117135490 [Drosophila mauritiana]|uniref:Uncharacterized protein LOC117135490 n=1 Tax=Drosophila mauritiana TaxID=7226 RepID=A0A6P8J8C1_DROMA|nr:uncharacterized protein LOC117135490 [Drosophila mauritiana]